MTQQLRVNGKPFLHCPLYIVRYINNKKSEKQRKLNEISLAPPVQVSKGNKSCMCTCVCVFVCICWNIIKIVIKVC